MNEQAKKIAIDKYGAMDKPVTQLMAEMTEDGFSKKEIEKIIGGIGEKKMAANDQSGNQDNSNEQRTNSPEQQFKQDAKKLTQKGTKGMSKEQIAHAQANHPSMKWFDEFEVKIFKVEAYNIIADKREAVTTHFKLVDKKHPKFIEQATANGFNTFADGITADGFGKLLLEKGKYQSGDELPYKDWCVMVGRDLKKDRNYQLLKIYVEDAN